MSRPLLLVIGLQCWLIDACAAPGPAPESRACDALPAVRFAEPLCDRLRANTKHITLRSRHRRELRVGQWVRLVCMQSQRQFRARLTHVRHTTWAEVTAQELHDDGFASRARLLPVMRRYYPGITATDHATVYRWDHARPCGARHPPP